MRHNPNIERRRAHEYDKIARNLGEFISEQDLELFTNFNVDNENNEMEKRRPQPKDFQDVYSQDEIKQDEEEVARLENNEFDPNYQQKPRAAEYLIATAVDSGGWLEQEDFETKVSLASKYDDYNNATDLVVTATDENGESIHLGIDVTTSEIDTEIDDKLRQVKNQLKKDKLPEIKYYSPEGGSNDQKGRLKMPKVIVSLDSETLPELIKTKKGLRPGKTLDNHAMQAEFRQEIIDQLIVNIEVIINNNLKKGSPEKSLDTPSDALSVDLSNLNDRQKEIVMELQKTLSFVENVRQKKNPRERVSLSRARGNQVLRMLAPKGTARVLEEVT